MKRRTLLVACGGLPAALAVGQVNAALQCGPFVPPGVQQCQSGIVSSLAHVAAAAVGGQHLSQWCWAACIEMVFTYYGYEVPQERIVQETWGRIVDLPGQPAQILRHLNRAWTDESGRSFRVSGDVYSANAITASQDLAQDMPLIIGTMGHAMVLTSLVYLRDPYGSGSVNAAIVRDPWPGRGRRTLSAQEWFRASFLARIRVAG
jgi:Papain-like cysteine protease AvrRpt2